MLFEYGMPSGIAQTDVGIPNTFKLNQNYPNPFNPSTTIEYSVPVKSNVTLQIFNQLGELVETLVEREQPPGIYRIQWRPEMVASGTYFYRLETEGFSEVRRLLFLK